MTMRVAIVDFLRCRSTVVMLVAVSTLAVPTAALAAWEARANRLYESFGYAVAVGVNGQGVSRIYTFGGFADPGPVTSAVQGYAAGTDTWTPFQSMPSVRAYPCAVTAADGRIYVFGGEDNFDNALTFVEAYDPRTDTWTTKTPMPAGRIGPACVAVGAHIFVMGGSNNGTKVDVWQFDPAAGPGGTWTSKANMPTLSSPTAALGYEGQVYVAGSGHITYAYAPGSDSWTQVQPLAFDAVRPSMTALGSRVYLLSRQHAVSLGPLPGNASPTEWKTLPSPAPYDDDETAATLGCYVYAVEQSRLRRLPMDDLLSTCGSVNITADNAYSFGHGSLTGPTALMGNIQNCASNQDILSCATGPEHYDVTIEPGDDYLYVVAWSDNASTSGVLAQIFDYVTVYSGTSGWEVYATGIDLPCGGTPPTLADVRGQILLANSDAGTSGSSKGWVSQAPTSNVGTLAIGQQNNVDGSVVNCGISPNVMPRVCSTGLNKIDPAAHWMWYDPNAGGGANPFCANATGNGEYLIFRKHVSAKPLGPYPAPMLSRGGVAVLGIAFMAFGAAILFMRRRRQDHA